MALRTLVLRMSSDIASLKKDVTQAKNSLRSIEKSTKDVSKSMKESTRILGNFKQGFINLSAQIYVVERAFRMVGSVIENTFIRGLKAVEDFQMNLIQLSAVTMQFMKRREGEDLADMWGRAKRYAEGIYPTIEKIAIETMLTGEHTMMVATQFAKHSVLLDANKKKAVEGFKAMANMIAIMTKGQGVEKQIVSEINSLMETRKRQGAVIYDQLKKMLPNIKEQMKEWKKTGTVFENLLPYLKGFNMASKEIKFTWEAIRTTLKTTTDRILRTSMQEAYKLIMRLLLAINTLIDKHRDKIQTGIYKTWVTIKNIIKSVWNIIYSLREPLKIVLFAIGDILKGWGYIFAILAPITQRFAYLIEATVEWVRLIWLAEKALTAFFSGQKNMANLYWQQVKDSWKNIGRKMGKALASGLGAELEKSLAEFNKSVKWEFPKLEMPEMENFEEEVEDKKKALAKYQKWYEKQLRDESRMLTAQMDKMTKDKLALDKWLTDEMNKLTLDRFEYERAKLLQIYMEKAEVWGWTEKLYKAFVLRLRKIDDEEAEWKKQQLQKIRDQWQRVAEASIEYKIALINLREEMLEISSKEAVKQKIEEYKKLIDIQQQHLDTMKVETAEEVLAWQSVKNSILASKEALIDLQVEYKKFFGTYVQGWQDALKEMHDEVITAYEAGYEIAKTTAQSMQEAFSDLFFDVMKGELKDWKDYFMQVLDAIQRKIADVLADWALFGTSGAGGGGGGLLSWLSPIISGIFGGAGAGASSGMGSVTWTGSGYGLMQHGGKVYAGRSYLVGEKGAEIFRPTQSGEIIPHGKINYGSLSVGVNVYVNEKNNQVASDLRSEIEEAVRNVIERHT